MAAGTVAGGLERLEPLFQPLYDALLARNAAIDLRPGRRDPLDGLHRPGRQDGASLVAVGLPGRGHGGLSPRPQPQPRSARGPFPGRRPRGADGRPLLGLQGHGPGEAGGRGAGLLLVARPARFRQGRQGLAGAQRVGLGLAAPDSRLVSATIVTVDRAQPAAPSSPPPTPQLRQTVAAMQAQADARVGRPETADTLPQGAGRAFRSTGPA